jgi:hypothetical protein
VTIVGLLIIIGLGKMLVLIDKSREKTTAKNRKNISLAIDENCMAPDGGYDYPTSSTKLKEILEKAFNNKIPRAVLRRGANVPASNRCYVAADPKNIPVEREGGWVLVTAGIHRGTVFINTTAIDTAGKFYTSW